MGPSSNLFRGVDRGRVTRGLYSFLGLPPSESSYQRQLERGSKRFGAGISTSVMGKVLRGIYSDICDSFESNCKSISSSRIVESPSFFTCLCIIKIKLVIVGICMCPIPIAIIHFYLYNPSVCSSRLEWRILSKHVITCLTCMEHAMIRKFSPFFVMTCI